MVAWSSSKSGGAGSLRGPRSSLVLFLPMLATLLLGLLSCGDAPEAGADVEVVGPPVRLSTATLADEVEDLPGGRISWSTYWELCWEEYPDAAAYELQPLTGEGSTNTPLRQNASCYRIEAAAGENERSQGLLNRDTLLAMQEGQLAYRVRAVLQNGRVSEWSTPAAVGDETIEEPETGTETHDEPRDEGGGRR